MRVAVKYERNKGIVQFVAYVAKQIALCSQLDHIEQLAPISRYIIYILPIWYLIKYQ